MFGLCPKFLILCWWFISMNVSYMPIHLTWLHPKNEGCHQCPRSGCRTLFEHCERFITFSSAMRKGTSPNVVSVIPKMEHFRVFLTGGNRTPQKYIRSEPMSLSKANGTPKIFDFRVATPIGFFG